jgi:hypothetical protein
MKKTLSTYSRMFLVTPTVYEKLLNCLDEKDKKITENLNISNEKKGRPSDEYIQELNIESFNEPREVTSENENEEEEVSQTDQNESDIIYKDNPSVIEAESMESEPLPSTSSQLNSPCLRSEQGEVIPSGGLVYRPPIQKANFKAVKEPIISIPRLSQGEIDIYTKQKQPIVSLPRLSQKDIDIFTKPRSIMQKPVFKKPILSIPKLSQQEISAYTNKPVLSIPKLNQGEIDIYTKKSNPQVILQKLPDLQQAQIDAFEKSVKSKEKLLVPSIKKKKETTKVKNFQCPVCMKFWRSKWDLRRHLSTVHSNFKEKQNIEQVQALPDTDETMVEQSENFPIWTRTRSQKRTSSQAKLPTLKPKFRPPGGDDEGEYESWK